MPIANVDKETAKGLLTLKARIKAAKIPPSRLDQSVLLATWNIREFGKTEAVAGMHHRDSPAA